MFAPAHVMDNAIVGSSTGRLAGGLTAFGREALAALEEQSVIVDLAHMSVVGVEETLAALSKPPVLSHTGLTDVARRGSRWRRYSAANRNVPASLTTDVATAGGLVGVCLATQLLGASDLSSAARTFARAIESAGEHSVAIGSDMDGALEMLVDVEGLPALGSALLDRGLPVSAVRGVMGQNALSWLASALPAT
jgi:microsomal dipeptidase-like Zn-dependent dipeptidase